MVSSCGEEKQGIASGLHNSDFFFSLGSFFKSCDYQDKPRIKYIFTKRKSAKTSKTFQLRLLYALGLFFNFHNTYEVWRSVDAAINISVLTQTLI